MKRYEKQVWSLMDPQTFAIDPRFDDPIGAVHEDLEFVQCKVDGGALGDRARRPEDRTVVRRVKATKCAVSVSVGPVMLDDVEIADLRTGSALWVKGAVFRHVTLSGKIGSLVLTNHRWALPEADEQAAFDASAKDFYTTVDWALDISQAQFASLDWRLSIPARLVRRDPETQVVVKRERVLEEKWRKVPLHMIVAIALENFLQFGHPEMILAASKASKRFKEEMESIEALRQAGIIEPD